MLGAFAEAVAALCSRSSAAPGYALRWTIIANPKAGGFTIAKRWKKHEAALKTALAAAAANPPREDARPSEFAAVSSASGLIPTTGPGCAGEIAAALLRECSARDGTFHLIITAGGDGTSLEVLQELFAAPEALRLRCAVLRLPMGTGNDGADAPVLDEALRLLILPSALEKTRAVRLSTAAGKTWPGGKPFLAFNILSVGLDAFVTRMTNKMKGRFPGDSYKLWVDIAALLYDRLYKAGPFRVQGYDESGAETLDRTEKLLLCAMGISGRRSYGSGKKILPDERNVCAVRQMPVLRKLALKGLFTSGRHIVKHESIMANASRLIIGGEQSILAQMDGEAVLLDRNDFPIVMELTRPAVQVLKLC
jgi:diacylglycerol kinase family enzyme